MRSIRAALVIALAALAALAAVMPAAATGQDPDRQLRSTLQETIASVQSIDAEVAALQRLLTASSPRPTAAQAAQRETSVKKLRDLARTLDRNGKTVRDLAAQDKDPQAASRARMVDGYAAEFYAGTRLQYSKAADGFPLKAGAKDAEAMRTLTLAVEGLRKSASGLGVPIKLLDLPGPVK